MLCCDFISCPGTLELLLRLGFESVLGLLGVLDYVPSFVRMTQHDGHAAIHQYTCQESTAIRNRAIASSMT